MDNIHTLIIESPRGALNPILQTDHYNDEMPVDIEIMLKTFITKAKEFSIKKHIDKGDDTCYINYIVKVTY